MKKDKKKIDILKEEIDCMMTNAQDIASKTQALTKISNQQNMLSLNASIEAARAGDAGRGFTIVAKQMGELAKSSSKIYTKHLRAKKNRVKASTSMKKTDGKDFVIRFLFVIHPHTLS